MIAPGTLLLVALIAAGLIALGWWLFISSEGVYLGRGVVIWLYDVFATRYDDIKHFSKQYDHMFLAQPIMENIATIKTPLVLDVATGTGRLPLTLLRHKHFQGKIIGVDLSRKMLTQAAYKFKGDARVTLLWNPAEHLPFPDNTFDVVTCLEALEFMSNREAVLTEFVRVLRPNGLMLITNRINTRLLPGKVWSDDEAVATLTKLGMEQVMVDYWQVDYNRVWGRKCGASLPTLARPLAEILRCPNCDQALMVEDGDGFACPHCHFRAPIMEDSVIELVPAP